MAENDRGDQPSPMDDDIDETGGPHDYYGKPGEPDSESFVEGMEELDEEGQVPPENPEFPKRGNSWKWAIVGMIILLIIVIFVVVFVMRGTNSEPAAAEAPRGDVILTTFQWDWDSVARECTDTIGPAGFGYVQISPPQETIQGEEWWTSYQPVSYSLDSKLGTAEEFQNMVDVCEAAGVGIVVDAVINHMAAVDQSPGTGVAGTQFGEDDFPGLYTADDFNECRTNITNYRNREQVQGCRLLGLQDLATSHEHVQDTIVDYLDGFIEMGVAGFRIDAAKHIPAEDLAQIKSKLVDPDVLWIQEVIRGGDEPIKPEEYVGTGKVNEFAYGRLLVDDFNNQIKYLEYMGNGLLPSADAVVFVDNHDTERDGSTLNYKAGDEYLLANIFMLAWDYGQPAVYTGYTFDNNDQGAPGATATSVPDVDCSSDQWTCLQNWDEIRAMVEFHNQTAGTPVTNWWTNGANVIAFERGGDKSTGSPTAAISGDGGAARIVPTDVEEREVATRAPADSGLGFVVINNEDSTYTAGSGQGSHGQFGEDNPEADAEAGSKVSSGSLVGPKFQTSMPKGKYCNVLVPDCGDVVEVASDGSLAAEIPAGKAIAIHVGARA